MPTDCETNVLCQITNIKTDIARLYDRTDDINDLLVTCCDEDTTTPPVGGGGTLARTISTQAELETARQAGGKWYVIALVPLTHTFKLDKPLQLIGFSLDGTKVGFSLNYSPGEISSDAEGTRGSGRDMFRPFVGRCEFRNLYFTMNHPLVTGFSPNPTPGQPDLINDSGAAIAVYGITDTNIDLGDIIVDNCEFNQCPACVFRSADNRSNPTIAVPMKRLRITNNYCHDFFAGIYLNGAIENALIENNVCICVDKIPRTARSVQNTVLVGSTITPSDFLDKGIYLANGAERTIISKNKVSWTPGLAIEVFNYHITLQQQCQIINNICNDCLFGISAVGNESLLVHGNSILRAHGIGIEIIQYKGDPLLPQYANKAEYIVSNNSIKDTLPGHNPYVFGPDQNVCGIYVNCVETNTLICNNQIHKVSPSLGFEGIGIQIIGRTVPPHQLYITGGESITIIGNRFTDTGSKGVWINGTTAAVLPEEEIYRFINIEGNTFVYTAAYAAAWPETYQFFPSILVRHPVGSVVVRNNTSLIPNALWAVKNYGTYFFQGKGRVYCGESYEGPIDSSLGDGDTVFTTLGQEEALPIGGSNIRIPY